MLGIKSETAVGFFILAACGIFFYMSIQMGTFRFNKGSYNSYVMYFSDISGLNKKADVKIAGVKVGWVDTLELLADQQQVSATIMITKECILHSDASGIIRQEGLLGTKFLEIIPGSCHLPVIENLGQLSKSNKNAVSLDQVFNHIGLFSQRLDALVNQHQPMIDATLQSLQALMADLKNQLPSMNNDIRKILEQLSNTLLPGIEHSVERASLAVDRDFNRIATKVESTTNSLEKIINKFDTGTGVIGQLMNDDESYHDIRIAIQGLKNYFAKVDRLSIVFDTHLESMHGVFEREWFRDAKGYFDVRIHPTEDYFYLAGLVGTLSGTIYRYETHRRWFKDIDNECQELVPGELLLTDEQKLRFAPLKKKVVRSFDMPTFNIQFGKIYNNIAVRFGIIESSIGVGLDLDVPFESEHFRWVTTFEIFDFRGRKRFEDDRPHLKWLNRLFMTKNTYLVFGADDFISRHNKNSFFGVGLRFGDDDVKYIFPQVNVSV